MRNNFLRAYFNYYAHLLKDILIASINKVSICCVVDIATGLRDNKLLSVRRDKTFSTLNH